MTALTPAASSSVSNHASSITSAAAPLENGENASATPFGNTDIEDNTISHRLEDATLTIRIIKNFEYRTTRNLVLKGLDLRNMTVSQLMERCRHEIKTQSGFKPYRTIELDTLKLYTMVQAYKTMNLIINLDHDEWILTDLDQTMEQAGASHETEFSLFNREAYEAFKAKPEFKWD